jgi:hypothetical protein
MKPALLTAIVNKCCRSMQIMFGYFPNFTTFVVCYEAYRKKQTAKIKS